MIDPDCHYGDHWWNGESVCSRCGKQLRCICGQFIREEDLDKHIGDEENPGPCPTLRKLGE